MCQTALEIFRPDGPKELDRGPAEGWDRKQDELIHLVSHHHLVRVLPLLQGPFVNKILMDQPELTAMDIEAQPGLLVVLTIRKMVW